MNMIQDEIHMYLASVICYQLLSYATVTASNQMYHKMPKIN